MKFHPYKSIICCSLMLTCSVVYAQPKKIANNLPPKLIVGIVVDQMRYDYIPRFWNKYSDKGFKKLVAEGANCTAAHYNYFPTYTGPGHASIYTGTTPAVHGIINNSWYDRRLGRALYVTEDLNVNGVGGTRTGKNSPANLETTTFSDELKMFNNNKSIVIALSLKDRGSILPGGRNADAAYWLDDSSGNFITSTWYREQLPQWVIDFNAQHRVMALLQSPWKTLLPIEQYTESTSDDVRYEGLLPGETKPVFPHFSNPDFITPELIREGPAGNTLTKEFALAALKGEKLGKDEFPDLLAISFSATDYVGHRYGTNAIETEDTYLRLDRDLGELIEKIEAQFGKDQVLFFLTSDHGACPNPDYLEDNNIDGGFFSYTKMKSDLNQFLESRFGPGQYILNADKMQLFLNRDLLTEKKLDLTTVESAAVTFLNDYPDVFIAIGKSQFTATTFDQEIPQMMQMGYHMQRSGEIYYSLKAGHINWSGRGTDHGSVYDYDTHVPIIFYGAGVKAQTIDKTVHPTDIAATICQLLHIQPPAGNIGKPIELKLKKQE